MQPAIAAPTTPVKPALDAVETDHSNNGFSLELSSPNEDESDLVFDDSQQNAPQIEAQPTENMLPWESSVSDTGEAIELDNALANQTADENLADDETFTPIATQTASAENPDKPYTVVVDYNSNPLVSSLDNRAHQTQKSQETIWQSNPFINNTPKTSSAATAVAQDTDSIQQIPQATISSASQPEANNMLSLNNPHFNASETNSAATAVAQDTNSIQQIPQTTISSVSQPYGNSVLSLNDREHDNLAFTTPTVPAPTAPATIQPYHEQALVNDQVSVQPVQIVPQAQRSLNNADALKAVHHIEYGKTLSRRGAAFTARQEFLAAMQVIATSNDKASEDNRHSKALKMAMLAMREANDFSVANSEQQIHMDVASVVESHRSQVLSPAQAKHLSPVQAMNRYFAHAQEQLDLAGGRNVVSAEVFYCMGKLHTFLNRNQKVLGPYETAQSVIYHQAALLSDNQHHRSSNELGVLLARSGRLEQSKLLFERSLMAQPTIRTWQNLA